MRIVIIDGSARKGNTLTAINTFIKGASEGNQIEVIHPEKLRTLSECHRRHSIILRNDNIPLMTDTD